MDVKTCRFSPEEYAMALSNARKCGMTFSAFLRDLVTGRISIPPKAEGDSSVDPDDAGRDR